MPDSQSDAVDIPPGLGPGDVPTGLSWPKSLWIVLPPTPTESQRESLSRLRIKAREYRDLLISETRVENKKGLNGIIYPLVPENDVAALYRRAHRARTAVIATCGAKVLLDISERPTNSGCLTLERFIQYKCLYSLVSRPEEVDRSFANALAWMTGTHCEGPRDPRCLPTAVFETVEQYPLDTHAERQMFIRAHKKSRNNAALTDARTRTWQTGPAHTLDLIQVGGYTLPIGFHWDVQAARDSIIATGWERWRLPGRGYVNIHPDALIRGGNATKTHPSSTEKSEAKTPRTPRSLRQRKG